jgi:hypothetical protein
MIGRPATASPDLIRTPDQRLRIYISSAFNEMQTEAEQACQAVRALRMTPVVFEGGARPHPPRELYQAYIQQSHVFIGVYGSEYGWVAPDLGISTLEDEYRMAAGMPRLIYVREAPARDSRLEALLEEIRRDAAVAYKYFSNARARLPIEDLSWCFQILRATDARRAAAFRLTSATLAAD